MNADRQAADDVHEPQTEGPVTESNGDITSEAPKSVSPDESQPISEKRLAANRRNAQKSTGPKTPAGKAVSCQNSRKHGILSVAPIIKGTERHKEWDAHLNGFFAGFKPVGYVEELLVHRLATIAWRLSRVAKYEVEVSNSRIACIQPDLERDEAFPEKPSDPADAREKMKEAALVINTLTALSDWPDGEKLDRESAVAVLWALSRELPSDIESVSIPGVPDDDDEFGSFDDWTAGLLRTAIAAHARPESVSPESLMRRCMSACGRDYYAEQRREKELTEEGRRWKLLLNRENQLRRLLPPDVLAHVIRYETSLERSLFRNLHELQRLQAARLGAVLPVPIVGEIDVNIHPPTKS